MMTTTIRLLSKKLNSSHVDTRFNCYWHFSNVCDLMQCPLDSYFIFTIYVLCCIKCLSEMFRWNLAHCWCKCCKDEHANDDDSIGVGVKGFDCYIVFCHCHFLIFSPCLYFCKKKCNTVFGHFCKNKWL